MHRALQRGELRRIAGVAEIAAQSNTRNTTPPHFHETYTFGLFRTGGGTVWCRGGEWKFGIGQIAVLDPREVHWGRFDSPDSIHDLIYPDPALLTACFGSPEPGHFPEPVLTDPASASTFHAAFDAAMGGDAGPLRAAILGLFARHACAPRPIRREGALDRRLQPGPSEDAPSVAAMSAAAGLSRSHFSRLFRQGAGLTPRDHRRQLRVRAARALIEQGMDLSCCAAEAGFSDQAHMTRQIRSVLGVTPAALRLPSPPP